MTALIALVTVLWSAQSGTWASPPTDPSLPPIGLAERSPLTLGVQSSSYFFSRNSFGDSFYPEIDLKLNLGVERRWRVDGGAYFSAAPSLFKGGPVPFNVEFNELYLTLGNPDMGHFSLGRKRLGWSTLDSSWKLGIWEPRFQWDALNPQEVGLAGVFWEWERPGIGLSVFGSGIHVPDRGEIVAFQDGKVVSYSPGFQSPPSTETVLGTATPTRYFLEPPNMAQFLLGPSIGIRARVGDESKDTASPAFWSAASYAYKPLNQALLSFETSSNVAMSPPTGDVHFVGRQLYHHLLSLDAGVRGSHFSSKLGSLFEFPIRDQTLPGWTTQEIQNAIAISPEVSAWVGPSTQPDFRATIGFIQQWGGNAPDQGPDAANTSHFGLRYPYQTATQIRLEKPLGKFLLTSRVLYDIGHDAGIFDLGVDYFPNSHWKISAGAEFVGTSWFGRQGIPLDFALAQYRFNDRVQLGVSYAF